MHTLKIGDVTITRIIERDGPWRQLNGRWVSLTLNPSYSGASQRRRMG